MANVINGDTVLSKENIAPILQEMTLSAIGLVGTSYYKDACYSLSSAIGVNQASLVGVLPDSVWSEMFGSGESDLSSSRKVSILIDTLALCMCEAIRLGKIVVDVNSNGKATLCSDIALDVIKCSNIFNEGELAIKGVDLVTPALSSDSTKFTMDSAQYWLDVYRQTNGMCKVDDEVEDVSSELEKEILSYFATNIFSTVEVVLEVYKELFASGYEVIKPFGILCPEGCLTIKGSNKLRVVSSPQFSLMYEVLAGSMNLSCEKTRQFSSKAILQSGSALTYFPFKLLEYAMGRDNSSSVESLDTYPRHSKSVSWESYSNSAVKVGVKRAVEAVVLERLMELNVLKEGAYKETSVYDEVLKVLENMKTGITSCIVVSTWSTSGDRVVGFKLRVSDMLDRLPTDNSIIEEILTRGFMGYVGDSKALIPVVKRGRYIKEFSHEFDIALCNAEPLFAYKALESLQYRGIQPSWDTLILGKADDDTILSAGVGSTIDLGSSLTHMIVAGSRSGKGVMTLNILASAIASSKPIFYIDRKPDMASLMKHLSNGRMFCINGTYSSDQDYYKEYSPEKMVGWNKHIPEFVAKGMKFNLNSSNDFGDVFYLRAVMFALSIVYARVKIGSGDVYNSLGGDNGVVIVVDEFTNFSKSVKNIVGATGCVGSNVATASSLSAFDSVFSNADTSKKADKSKELSEYEIYCTEFMRKFSDTLGGLHEIRNAGLKDKESPLSNIFVLGQDIELEPSVAETVVYNKTGRGISASEKGCYLTNLFYSLDADGFLGYNGNYPNYMNCVPGSISYSRLNKSARNFAYVSKFSREAVRKGDVGYTNSATYFKPFLLLNDGDEKSTFVSQLKSFCSSNRLSFEDVKARNLAPDGKTLKPEVGFEAYIRSQSQGVDIQSVLSSSYDIGNYIVKQLGYSGDCIDFIFDLRPECLFSPQDIVGVLAGSLDFSDLETRLPDYTKYFGGGFGSFDNGGTSSYSSIDNAFNIQEGADITPSVEVNQTDMYGGEVATPPISSQPTFDLYEERAKQAYSYDSEPELVPDATTLQEYSLDEEVEDADEYDEGYVSNEDEFEESTETVEPATELDRVKQENKQLRDSLLAMQKTMQDFMASVDMASQVNKAKDDIRGKTLEQERLTSEPFTFNVFGRPFKVQRFDSPLDFGEKFRPSSDFRDSARNFAEITKLLLDEIAKMFGGLDRISELAVISEGLIINGVSFEPILSEDYISGLPVDIQNLVREGRFAWLLNFGCIRNLSSITTLFFDDTDFVYKKVRIDLGRGNTFEPKDLFDICKKLNALQIGEYVFDRKNRDTHDGIFHQSRRSTEIADSIDKATIGASKASWGRLRDSYRDWGSRGTLKTVASMTAWGTAGVVTGATGLGFRLGRSIKKHGGRAVRNLWDAMNENVK